jgi:hypothetical protein
MVKIQTKGFEELLKKLSEAGDTVVAEMDAEFEIIAKEFVARAKNHAPKDVGFLAGAITYRRLKDLQFEITSGSKYAGYLEFGTKKNYVPIPGFESVAAGIHGPGEGTLAEFKDNIREYIGRHKTSITNKRTGKPMDLEEMVNFIVFSILKNGIKAQPYFFRQMAQAEDDLEKNLKNMGERILK